MGEGRSEWVKMWSWEEGKTHVKSKYLKVSLLKKWEDNGMNGAERTSSEASKTGVEQSLGPKLAEH